MAIISDEIKDIQNMDLPRQVDVLYKYIKYLKEQIDFWASNREKDMAGISGDLESIQQDEAQDRQRIEEISEKMSVSAGTVTWDTTNVTGDVTRKVWHKIGRTVIAHVEFTPLSGKIANGTQICTGLPVEYESGTPVFQAGTRQMRVTNGTLVWYFPSNTTDLTRVDVTLTYISAT